MAFTVAQRLGQEGGEPLTVGSKTLHKRLHERGLLASVDDTRQKLTVRRTLQGSRRDVLHFKATTIMDITRADSAASADDRPTEKPSQSASKPAMGRKGRSDSGGIAGPTSPGNTVGAISVRPVDPAFVANRTPPECLERLRATSTSTFTVKG